MKGTIVAILAVALFSSIAYADKEKLSYTIFNEDVYDASEKTQVRLEILYWGKITKDGLREVTEEGIAGLLKDLYSSISKRKGFKYHKSPTHIAIFIYVREGDWDYKDWAGRLMKGYRTQEPEITIKLKELLKDIKKEQEPASKPSK